MAGILASALAGGLAGAGEAAQKSLATMQKTEAEKELAKFKIEMEHDRRVALENLRHGHDIKMQDRAAEIQAEQAQLEREGRMAELGVRLGYEFEKLMISQTHDIDMETRRGNTERGLISARVSAERKLKSETPTYQTADDGRLLRVVNGEADFVTNKSTGEPVQLRTSLSDAQKEKLKSLRDQHAQMERRITELSKDPMSSKDPKTVEMIREARNKQQDYIIQQNEIFGTPGWIGTDFDPYNLANTLADKSKTPEQRKEAVDFALNKFGRDPDYRAELETVLANRNINLGGSTGGDATGGAAGSGGILGGSGSTPEPAKPRAEDVLPTKFSLGTPTPGNPTGARREPQTADPQQQRAELTARRAQLVEALGRRGLEASAKRTIEQQLKTIDEILQGLQ